MRCHGCIPASLQRDPHSFYAHVPDDFTVAQRAGLLEAFNRFDMGNDGIIDAQ